MKRNIVTLLGLAFAALSAVSCRDGLAPGAPSESEALTQRQVLSALCAAKYTVYHCYTVDETRYRLDFWEPFAVSSLKGSREYPDGIVSSLTVDTSDKDLVSFTRVTQYNELNVYYNNDGSNRKENYDMSFNYHAIIRVKFTNPDGSDYDWKIVEELGVNSGKYNLRGRANDRYNVPQGETFDINYEITESNFEPEDMGISKSVFFKDSFGLEVLNRDGAKGTLRFTVIEGNQHDYGFLRYGIVEYTTPNGLFEFEF